MEEGLRHRLCVVHGLAKFTTMNFCIISLYYSVMWRAFLVLYPQAFVTKSKTNLKLFQQLYWLVTAALFLILHSAVLTQVLRGDFTFQAVLGNLPQTFLTVSRFCGWKNMQLEPSADDYGREGN